MNWDKKLTEVTEKYNALLQEEQQLQNELVKVHDARIQAFGKCQAVQEMYENYLKEESLAASNNGSEKPKVESLPGTPPEVHQKK